MVAKYDLNGTMIWGKAYGSIDVEYASDLTSTSTDAYIYIVGFTSGNFETGTYFYFYNYIIHY